MLESDMGSNRLVRALLFFVFSIGIVREASAQIVTTYAGGVNYNNGIATNLAFPNPKAVAIAADGSVYFSDFLQNSRVYKLSRISGTISVVAGGGTLGAGSDGGPATNAALSWVAGIAVDAAGNVYISAWGSSAVRRVNNAGTISTVAGNGA